MTQSGHALMHRKCSFDIDVITLQIRSQVAKAVANVYCAFLPPIFLSPYRLASGMTCRSGAGPTEISPVNGRS
jgi:hypothetical protein